jgi:hypothetical protein
MLNVQKVKNIARFAILSLAVLSLVLPAIMPAFAAVDDYGLDAVAGAGGAGLQKADLKATIGQLLKVALGFLGIIAVIIVLVGGFKYMTAGGSEEKVGDAKKWIISGIIGLAIILSAYAITSFVLTSFTGAITASPQTD